MWNGVFHPDVTRRETGSGNTGAGSTTEGSELPCATSFGERCALQASLEGVLSPNDFEQPPSKGRSVVGMVRRLLRRCPLSLDEGHHRSDVGLQRDLLVLRPGEARLALLQGRHPRGTGHGLRAVRFHKTATVLLICLLSRIIVYLRIKIDTLLS